MKWLLLAVLSAVPVYAQEIEISVEETSLMAINSLYLPPDEVVKPKVEDYSLIACSCVKYVRDLSEYQPPRVERALDIQPNQKEPKVGGWALFSYQPDGHAAYIIEVGQDKIEVLEFNRIPCKEEKRTIYLSDPFLRGYYYD